MSRALRLVDLSWFRWPQEAYHRAEDIRCNANEPERIQMRPIPAMLRAHFNRRRKLPTTGGYADE